ncbi:MAG: hypothetical protein AAF570_12020 [Bacteroidota bacterium]
MTTNQPGVYIGPQTVFPGNTIVELNAFGYRARLEGGLRNFVHPAVLARYGLTKKLELRASTSVRTVNVNIPQLDTSVTALTGANIGAQLQLIGAGQKLPATSLQFNLLLPNTWQQRLIVLPQLWLTTQIPLAPKFNAYVNMIGTYFHLAEHLEFRYVLAVDWRIQDRLRAFIEHTGLPRQQLGLEHGYNLGLAYALSRHLQIDFSGGISTFQSNVWLNANLGFAFRLAPQRNR